MENWVITRKGAPFQEIAEKFQIHPILARLIRNRDIVGDEQIESYLHGTILDLHDGMLMRDMSKAVEILIEKIHEGKKIRIIGDYDIDGINATYILLQGLNALGADVDIDIPDRMKDGYGLNRELIYRAFQEEVDTIVTCDNGIAASEEIAYGKSLGMTIIVTDHHEVPYEESEKGKRYVIPPADAVVDPKQEDCIYPFKELCGAAVAYKLVEAIFEVLGEDVSDIDYLMENVAIATIGDVMSLVGENRIFVKQGLDMLKRTQNMGLSALLECTGVDTEHLSPYHIGFIVGPCLNASGRLDTAKRALNLLCAQTVKEANILAGDLKALNDNRKDMTVEAVEQAVEQIENTALKEDNVLVVFLPDCHESLAGIVAGRIREYYGKPTFVITKAEEGIKGSGRSIDAYHMYEALNECKSLLTRFGGHKLAAGISLPEENLNLLRKQLNINSQLTENDLISQIELMGPFGKGNQRPLFVEKNLEILNQRVLGQKQNVLKMQVRDSQGTVMDAVYFGDVEKFQSYYQTQGTKKASFVYYPAHNDYRSEKQIQIVVQHYR